MANIAAADVTYTLLNQRTLGDSRKMNRVRMAFGDGALTYPAGGIPVSKGKLGCSVNIESLIVVDQGTSGYRFQYDQSAEKLVVLKSAHQHNLTITKGAVLTAGEVGVSADSTAATLNNNTIASTQVLATNTPVVSGDSLSEASALAIAAQTIEVEVIGW